MTASSGAIGLRGTLPGWLAGGADGAAPGHHDRPDQDGDGRRERGQERERLAPAGEVGDQARHRRAEDHPEGRPAEHDRDRRTEPTLGHQVGQVRVDGRPEQTHRGRSEQPGRDCGGVGGCERRQCGRRGQDEQGGHDDVPSVETAGQRHQREAGHDHDAGPERDELRGLGPVTPRPRLIGSSTAVGSISVVTMANVAAPRTSRLDQGRRSAASLLGAVVGAGWRLVDSCDRR